MRSDVAATASGRVALHPLQLIAVFLSFAAGYLLSYLLRNINAVLAPELAREFAVTPAALGALTSAYFLAFAAALLPLGIALDRFGPARTQLVLLAIAAFGCIVTASAQSITGLVAGRLLIGAGVSGSLMAGLKAIVLWFPRERTALLNGLFVAVGALGAIMATGPAGVVIGALGWRSMFAALAVATLLAAAALYSATPAPRAPAAGSQSFDYTAVLSNPHFWRLAPIAGLTIGSSWALQGLWAAPWLADVAGLGRTDVLRHLMLMGFALMAGSLMLGAAADALRRRGVSAAVLLPALAIALIAAELAIATQAPVPALLPWCVVAVTSAGTVVTYTASSEMFGKEAIGRANSALNVFHMLGAFAVQSGIGGLLSMWTADAAGHLPARGYAVALLVLAICQGLALLWYLVARPATRSVAAV